MFLIIYTFLPHGYINLKFRLEEIIIQKENRYYYLIIIACCALCISSIGTIGNCLGIFVKPISESLNVGIGDISLMITLMSLCSAFFGPILSRLIKKYDVRIIVSSGILSSICILISFSFFDNVIYFYIASIILGISLCCFSLIPVTIILGNWFKSKHGLVIGICSSFTGIGGALFNPIFNKIMVSFGWRKSFIIMAMIIAVIALPFSMFIIRLHPKDIGLKPLGENETNNKIIKVSSSSKSTKINLYSFILVLCFAILIANVVSLNSHISTYALSISFTSTVGATMISCSMIGNVLSKLALGYLSDRIGAIKSCTILLSFALLGLISLVFLDGQNVSIAYLSTFLYGVIFAPNATGIPLIIKQVFGSENYSKCYSIIAVFTSTSYALSVSLVGYLYDYFASYSIIIWAFIIITSIIFIILLLLAKLYKKEHNPELLLANNNI